MRRRSRGAFDLGETVDRYVIVEEIGVGGMATVYRARLDARGGVERVVAIKAIHPHLADDPRFVEMFLDEARISARIQHANVCSLLDFGYLDGVAYLVMEYLNGVPLHQVLARGRIPIPLAARIVADAARGLHAAHELVGDDGAPLGVVHRDVSPQNVVVQYDGTTKIVDFGVARARGKLGVTVTGEVKGKIAYMSPQQLRGGAGVDRLADVWGLGVILWESTLRKRLFSSDSDGETAVKVLQAPIATPTSIDPAYPPELEAIVMRALDRSLEQRVPTAGALADAIEEFLLHAQHRAAASDLSRWLEQTIPPPSATSADGAARCGRSSPALVPPAEPTRPMGTLEGPTDREIESPTTADAPEPRTRPLRVDAPLEPDTIPPRAPARPARRRALTGAGVVLALAGAAGIGAMAVSGDAEVTAAPIAAASSGVAQVDRDAGADAALSLAGASPIVEAPSEMPSAASAERETDPPATSARRGGARRDRAPRASSGARQRPRATTTVAAPPPDPTPAPGATRRTALPGVDDFDRETRAR